MAYMNQVKKKALAPGIRAVLKKYNMKGTIGVDNHSSLVVNIKSGELDLISNENAQRKYYAERDDREYYPCDNINVNHFWVVENTRKITKNETIANFYEELIDAMNTVKVGDSTLANHDNSDIMTDYFDVGWYIDINVGRWNKPYIYTGIEVGDTMVA